jgi:serine/threonine-protein kinase RsbT
MNETIAWVELARLPIAKIQDVLLARFVGRNEATKLGFAPAALTRIATAISEITRNVVEHAGCSGEIQIGRLVENSRSGLRIIVSDKGKGIEHPEQFMEEGKVDTLGSGLSGTRKLVEAFHLESAPGLGTTVTIDIWKREGIT